MNCPTCNTPVADVAVYCAKCGAGVRAGATRKRPGSYAVQSSESVTQLAVVSTLMPHTTRQTGSRYRWALAVAATMVMVFTLIGSLGAAILTAALAVPLVFLLYLYDLNVWEDTPLPVVAAVIGVTGVLATIVSIVFYRTTFREELFELSGSGRLRAGLGELPIGPFLLFVLVLPLIAVIVMNLGQVWLAMRPQFDDMIDGFTFGVAAGAAYAAAETIVAYSSVFSGQFRTTQGLDTWIPIILSVMIIKSLVYATATGLAIAAFSGKGEGFDGFKPSYFVNLAISFVALVVYWAGIRLFAYADVANWWGVLWGAFILALLVLRARGVLHAALLEAALEDAVSGHRAKAAVTDDGWCPECEMPLLPDALFCVACGQSVRAASGDTRRQLRTASTGGAA
jgi:hypothetical protein